jgi:phosphoglycerate kinase
MMKEMDFLGRALNHPQHPYFAILGGAKVSDKIKVIRSLLQRVDGLIVGGAMAYPFLKAQGKGVGASKCDPADVPLAADLLREIGAKGRVLLLPVDHVVARKVEDNAETRVVDDQIPDGWIGLDIGPKTVRLFCDRLRKARMVVWNGPMGFFEKDCFAAGTRAVAEALASSDAVTIVGGGDTATAVEEMGLGDKMSHVSTGGGASLAFLQGDELPGIAGLTDVKD